MKDHKRQSEFQEKLRTACISGQKIEEDFDCNGSRSIFKTSEGFVLRTQVIDDHPWKDRDFAPTFRVIPETEALAMIKKWQEAKEQAAAAQIAKQSEEAVFNTYIASLPKMIAGFCRGTKGCCQPHELTDDIGNYVMSIPKKAAREGWSVEKLSSYIDDQTSEGWGE